MPRVLLCNWAPPFEKSRRGGGVAVNQDNCLQALYADGWKVHVLSAGVSYDLLGGRLRIVPVAGHEQDAVVSDLVDFAADRRPHDAFWANALTLRSKNDHVTGMTRVYAPSGAALKPSGNARQLCA